MGGTFTPIYLDPATQTACAGITTYSCALVIDEDSTIDCNETGFSTFDEISGAIEIAGSASSGSTRGQPVVSLSGRGREGRAEKLISPAEMRMFASAVTFTSGANSRAHSCF